MKKEVITLSEKLFFRIGSSLAIIISIITIYEKIIEPNEPELLIEFFEIYQI